MQELYLREFEEARVEYNNKQTKDELKNHVNNDIIIPLLFVAMRTTIRIANW